MFVKALLTAAGLCLAATSANAVTYGGTFSGLNESTPNASTATGYGTLRIVGNSIEVSIAYSGLGSGLQAGHIHCCSLPGVNSGVAVGFGGLSTGSTSGTIVRTIDLTVASSFNNGFRAANGGTADGARAAFFTGLSNGRAYSNLHTTNIGSGEIRANLALVPEPASWAMMVVGFGLVGGAIRRRSTALATA